MVTTKLVGTKGDNTVNSASSLENDRSFTNNEYNTIQPNTLAML